MSESISIESMNREAREPGVAGGRIVSSAGSRARHRRQGMSLVEVMVALVILAFGLLGVAALQVRAITEGSSGNHLSTASAIARNRVEELNRVAWDAAELNATGGAWSGTATINTADESYTRTQRVTDNATNTIKSIEVRVGWSDRKRQNRTVVLSSARLREVDE